MNIFHNAIPPCGMVCFFQVKQEMSQSRDECPQRNCRVPTEIQKQIP